MTAATRSRDVHDRAYQAFALLRTAFPVAPVVSGVDRFFDLVTDWRRYLSPSVDELVPSTGHQPMLALALLAPVFRPAAVTPGTDGEGPTS
jgi:hypothetical protein